MAANLILNHGFKGFLFDGSETNIEVARSFFNKPDTLLNEPVINENVNHVLIDSGFRGTPLPPSLEAGALDPARSDCPIFL